MVFELLCCEIGMCLFSLYPNIAVLNVWEIHTTLDNLLEMLGKTALLLKSCTPAGPGQQAQPFLVPDVTISPP